MTSTTSVVADRAPWKHVRVWFGEHVIADYSGEPALVVRYANAMRRRFAGLRVTIDPVPGRSGSLAGEQ
jgi:hypothetical protein